MTRAEFDREIDRGSLYVGAPETVAMKIAATVTALGLSRFDLKYSAGPLRHDLAMQTIELYGREVIPRVRELLAAGSRNQVSDQAAIRRRIASDDVTRVAV